MQTTDLNRRGFLAAFAAAYVLDPEHLLWRPGAKMYSIPRAVEPSDSWILTLQPRDAPDSRTWVASCVPYPNGAIVTLPKDARQYVVSRTRSDIRFTALGDLAEPFKLATFTPNTGFSIRFPKII